MSDSVCELREKLNVLGYKQELTLASIPLVSAIFEDLVKTTESLRSEKNRNAQLTKVSSDLNLIILKL